MHPPVEPGWKVEKCAPQWRCSQSDSCPKPAAICSLGDQRAKGQIVFIPFSSFNCEIWREYHLRLKGRPPFYSFYLQRCSVFDKTRRGREKQSSIVSGFIFGCCQRDKTIPWGSLQIFIIRLQGERVVTVSTHISCWDSNTPDNETIATKVVSLSVISVFATHGGILKAFSSKGMDAQ